jgi:predicted ATP-dependent endonuclease of OLD family
MKLKSITLENFRSFKDPVAIKGLSDVNVFIGANNAGKSNIIEALRYVQFLVDNNQLKSYKEMVFDGDIRSEIRIQLIFSLSEDERKEMVKELFLDNPNVRVHDFLESKFLHDILLDVILGVKGIKQETIAITNVVNGYLQIVRCRNDGKRLRCQFLGLSEKCKNARLENIASGLRPESTRSPSINWMILNTIGINDTQIEHKLISLIRAYVKGWFWLQPVREATPDAPLGEQTLMHSTGNNVVQVLFTLQNNDRRSIARIQNEFLTIIPEIQRVDARLKGGNSIVTIEENNLDSIRDLRNVSSGLTQSLILASGILSNREVYAFLIEEPESHLHARSQRRLFETMKKEAENKQFFLTTHSTIFSSCDEKGSTYLVTKRNGASAVRKIQEPEEFKLVKECLGHRNSDLFGDECVVFIEGDSEENAFPIIAKSLGIDFKAKGIRLINVKGKDKVTKLHEYLKYLKDSDVIVYVVVDGNQRLKDCLRDWEREGLISSENWTMWDLEFEDCFNPDFIAKIVNDMYKESGVELNLTAEQLCQKEANTSVVKVLKRILYKQNLDLDKPELAERIAFSLAENIGKEGHKDTPPEIEIKKIVKLVDEDFPFPDVQKDVKPEKAYDIAEIRQTYPRAYEKWTSSDDLELSEKYREGMSINQLAKHFQRNQGAISSRLKKLGLQQ